MSWQAERVRREERMAVRELAGWTVGIFAIVAVLVLSA